jgi:hypothetical protein
MFYNFPQRIWNTDTNNRCARPTPVQHPNQSDLAAINYFYGTPAGIAAVSPRAPAALIQPPAAAPPPATMPAARGGGITPDLNSALEKVE